MTSRHVIFEIARKISASNGHGGRPKENIDRITHLISPVPVPRTASGYTSLTGCATRSTILMLAASYASRHLRIAILGTGTGRTSPARDETRFSKFDPVTAIPRDVRTSGQRRSDATPIRYVVISNGERIDGEMCWNSRARTHRMTRRTYRLRAELGLSSL